MAALIKKKRIRKKGSKPRGRPRTEEDIWVSKLKPFLERGLSIRKACLLSGVAHAPVYQRMNADAVFKDKLDALSSYQSNIVSDVFTFKLQLIQSKTQLLKKLYEKTKESELSDSDKVLLYKQIDDLEIKGGDITFLNWMAQNAKNLREEFGAHTEITGKGGSALGEVLDELEKDKLVPKTDYEQLGSKAQGQMVAANPLIQNQEQTGGVSDIQPEPNAIEASSGTGE